MKLYHTLRTVKKIVFLHQCYGYNALQLFEDIEKKKSCITFLNFCKIKGRIWIRVIKFESESSKLVQIRVQPL